MFPVSKAIFFARKIQDFGVTEAIKQQGSFTNMKKPMMVCSYRSSCLDLYVAHVDFQV